jgi:hypothetical protein
VSICLVARAPRRGARPACRGYRRPAQGCPPCLPCFPAFVCRGDGGFDVGLRDGHNGSGGGEAELELDPALGTREFRRSRGHWQCPASSAARRCWSCPCSRAISDFACQQVSPGGQGHLDDEKRSLDLVTMLVTIRRTETRKPVELRTFEPLTFCMPSTGLIEFTSYLLF